ncbi:MAG: chemotaxis protein CheW [Planctomycetales bacterium]|nr:chemotaxis protein CheW [Planctomycetales bacterium]
MLVLMCSVGTDRLAIPVQSVTEVIPRVELHAPLNSPDWLAGHFVYRGHPAPVVVLTTAMNQATNRLSDRIILTSFSINSHTEIVGLMVNGATTQELPYADADAAGRDGSMKSQWGTILLDASGMFHLVDLTTILRPEMLDILFPPTEGREGPQ